MKKLIVAMAVLICLQAAAQTREGLVKKYLPLSDKAPTDVHPIGIMPTFEVVDTLPSFRDTLPIIMLVSSTRNSGETKSVWAKLGYRLYKGKRCTFTNLNFENFPDCIVIWEYRKREY